MRLFPIMAPTADHISLWRMLQIFDNLLQLFPKCDVFFKIMVIFAIEIKRKTTNM